MSRVFEALTRVTEEKQRQVERPAEKIESAAAPVEGKKANSEQPFRTNRTGGSVNATVGKTDLKSVWDELRPLLCYLAAFSFFINVLFLVPAIFTQQVFDRVLSSRSQETLVVLFAGTVVALLILLLLDYLRHRLQNVVGNIVDERLSPPVVNAIVAKAARAPHEAGIDRIRDVAALRTVFSANGLTAVFDAPWAVVYVAVIWAFHPALGTGAALSAILMLALAWLNDRVSRRALEGLQKDGRRASQYVESSLRNAEVLQALGMTESLLERWRALQDQVAALQTRATRSSVTFTAVTRFVRQAIQIVMLGLGAYLVLAEHASAGVMIATTILLGRAVQPIEQLVGSWRMLTDARAAYRRLRELSDDFDQRTPRLTMPRPEGRLVAEGISYRAPGTENKLILNNINFAIAPGEALAIVGPSAAGKSTLARLLTGVWAPTAGTVRLDGANVADWPRQDLGPWIGYVPQDVELFQGSVADNIARLGRVDSEAVVAAAKRAGTHEMILSLTHGYDMLVGEQGSRLSPGQRQRIALARALYGDPQLVVLDEPNSNLDGAGEAALAQAMSHLRKEGVTSVVITHRPSLIAHVDKILVLDAGRVQHFGTASEVMKAIQQRPQAA
jgi:ATP-binding cassette, subfamily C, type I secretion system permease/ATPase